MTPSRQSTSIKPCIVLKTGSDSYSSESDDNQNDGQNGCIGPSVLEKFVKLVQCALPPMGKRCSCFILWSLFGCFMLVGSHLEAVDIPIQFVFEWCGRLPGFLPYVGHFCIFLYFYALTMILQIAKILQILAHLVLPTSWLKSTRDIVQEALAKYSADRLGLADYALESAGGSVLCSSETYFTKSGALYSVFGIPLWYHSSGPREVIQPEVQPGNCWAMDGTQGYVMVQLAMPIIVTAISLEHIPLELAPSGRLDSAPKDFMIIQVIFVTRTVKKNFQIHKGSSVGFLLDTSILSNVSQGKERSMDSPDIVLGKFTYHIDREPIQVYEIMDPFCVMRSDGSACGLNNKVFYIITLKILSNHGNPDFTCIYRLRVHGQPLVAVPIYY